MKIENYGKFGRDKAFSICDSYGEPVQVFAGREKEFILSKQLMRAGTSIGANVVEAQQAQSRPDYVSKLNIALKEAVETEYWLRLLHATNYLTEPQYLSVYTDCQEIVKLLAAIVKSSKQ